MGNELNNTLSNFMMYTYLVLTFLGHFMSFYQVHFGHCAVIDGRPSAVMHHLSALLSCPPREGTTIWPLITSYLLGRLFTVQQWYWEGNVRGAGTSVQQCCWGFYTHQCYCWIKKKKQFSSQIYSAKRICSQKWSLRVGNNEHRFCMLKGEVDSLIMQLQNGLI